MTPARLAPRTVFEAYAQIARIAGIFSCAPVSARQPPVVAAKAGAIAAPQSESEGPRFESARAGLRIGGIFRQLLAYFRRVTPEHLANAGADHSVTRIPSAQLGSAEADALLDETGRVVNATPTPASVLVQLHAAREPMPSSRSTPTYQRQLRRLLALTCVSRSRSSGWPGSRAVEGCARAGHAARPGSNVTLCELCVCDARHARGARRSTSRSRAAALRTSRLRRCRRHSSRRLRSLPPARAAVVSRRCACPPGRRGERATWRARGAQFGLPDRAHPAPVSRMRGRGSRWRLPDRAQARRSPACGRGWRSRSPDRGRWWRRGPSCPPARPARAVPLRTLRREPVRLKV